MEINIVTNSFEQTIKLGELIAQNSYQNLVITLSGDLGAGKTTLVKGIAKGLGIKEKVTSSTFNILKCYFIKPLPLYHIDAYRLNEGNKDIGLEEFIDGDGVCVIEWPMYIQEMIPDEKLDIKITHLGNDNRNILIKTDIAKLKILFDKLEDFKND